MFKFIHSADIHLDSPMHRLDDYEGAPVDEFRQATRRAFEKLVDLALEEDVSFVLIAGDLYDGNWKDYNTGLYLVAQLKRFEVANIPVFVVAGNHDAASRITKNLSFPENVKMFASSRPDTFQLEDIRVAVHGQSYSSPAVKNNLAVNYPDPIAGYFNIGLLHTCATGREGHEAYAPCSLEDLRNKGYDYWALGHIHQYEILAEDPPIVFSGNTQGRHVRETDVKGCVVVNVDDAHRAELIFTPTDVVRWARAEVDVTSAQDPYEVIDLIRTHLEALYEEHGGMPLAVRVFVHGETAAHDEFLSDTERWEAEIRSAGNDVGNGGIWVEAIRIETESPASELALPKAGAMGELLEVFNELAGDENARRELLTELADLGKKLPRELKVDAGGLQFDDQWIAKVLNRVKPMLIRHLLHKEGVQ